MKRPFYSRHHPGAHILILDTETTGSSWGTYEETFSKYQAIQFGAIVATSDTFQEVASLTFKVKFDESKYEWTDGAEKIHGITREDLQQNGLDAEEAAATLASFILEHFGTGKVMFAGHNPWFDIGAMQQLLDPFDIQIDLHHVVLDTSALGFVAFGKYRSNDLFELVCGGRSEQHDALDDARMTMSVLASIRMIVDQFGE